MVQFSGFCACPICTGALIQSGEMLLCENCKTEYKIQDRIPVLLPPDYATDSERRRYLENIEKLAKDDLVNPLEYQRDYRHKVLLDFVGNLKGKRVLDLASSNALFLSKVDAAFKVAFDLSMTYLKTIPESSDVILIQGDAEDFPFMPGFFDVIIMSDVLEHLLHPGNLVRRIEAISTPGTRVIVHIPWEENLESYKDSPYEFTHLRTFNAFTFREQWKNFEVVRSRVTYPDLKYPFLFRLDGKIPSFIYNKLVQRYFFKPGVAEKDLAWRTAKGDALPKGEGWLLWLFKPVFRMFELRFVDPTKLGKH